MGVTRNEIKKIARIYAGSILENAMGCGAYSPYLNDLDNEQLQAEINIIARRVSKTTGYIGNATLDAIVNAVINKEID